MVLHWQRLTDVGGHTAGLSLLADLFQEETGQVLPAIAKTPQGKPFFPDDPFHFSISHTKTHVFCCLSRENVGIDAEEIGRKIDPLLKERFCSPAEQSRIKTSDDLLRLWVLKESYAKFTGRGIGNYLKNTDFSPNDPRIQTIDGCYVAVFIEERNEPCCLIPMPM